MRVDGRKDEGSHGQGQGQGQGPGGAFSPSKTHGEHVHNDAARTKNSHKWEDWSRPMMPHVAHTVSGKVSVGSGPMFQTLARAAPMPGHVAAYVWYNTKRCVVGRRAFATRQTPGVSCSAQPSGCCSACTALRPFLWAVAVPPFHGQNLQVLCARGLRVHCGRRAGYRCCDFWTLQLRRRMEALDVGEVGGRGLVPHDTVPSFTTSLSPHIPTRVEM